MTTRIGLTDGNYVDAQESYEEVKIRFSRAQRLRSRTIEVTTPDHVKCTVVTYNTTYFLGVAE